MTEWKANRYINLSTRLLKDFVPYNPMRVELLPRQGRGRAKKTVLIDDTHLLFSWDCSIFFLDITIRAIVSHKACKSGRKT